MQETDWAGSEPQLNPPTSHVLAPGANLTIGLRMFLAASVQDRDAALAEAGYAVATAVPGAAQEVSCFGWPHLLYPNQALHALSCEACYYHGREPMPCSSPLYDSSAAQQLTKADTDTHMQATPWLWT